MSTNKLILYGAGGHGKVVLDSIMQRNMDFQVSLVDDDSSLVDGNIFGYDIFSLNNINLIDYQEFHIAIGNNKQRKAKYNQLSNLGIKPLTIIHIKSAVSSFAMINDGVFVASHSVVAPSAKLEIGVIVNHGAIVDHDCHIGSFSHIAPNATLGGGVVIGDQVLVGAGSVVLPGISVGDNVTIGAGSIVTKDITSFSTVVGNPARPV